MIDIISVSFCHILTVKQVDKTEHDTRNRNDRKEINLIPGMQKYRREQNSRNRTGSPDRRIILIVPVFPHIVHRSCNHPSEIQDQETETTESPRNKLVLHVYPKRKKSKHIHDQMCPICMDKTVRNNPVPLSGMYHPVRVTRQFIEQGIIIKTSN